VRFVLVGGFNTAFGYALFVLFEFGFNMPYLLALYGSYLISTIVAFILHRRVTYRASGTGRVLVDFVRFQGVYVVSLVFNSVALPVGVELLHGEPTVVQAVIVVVSAVVSYFGHKFFSFRRPAAATTDDAAIAAQD